MTELSCRSYQEPVTVTTVLIIGSIGLVIMGIYKIFQSNKGKIGIPVLFNFEWNVG